MTILYKDQYLRNLVTPSFESDAATEVDAIAAFSVYWRDKLIEIKAYMAVCLASMKDSDDLFSAKLTHYRKEWSETLSQAKASLTTTGMAHPGYFSLPVERG